MPIWTVESETRTGDEGAVGAGLSRPKERALARVRPNPGFGSGDAGDHRGRPYGSSDESRE